MVHLGPVDVHRRSIVKSDPISAHNVDMYVVSVDKVVYLYELGFDSGYNMNLSSLTVSGGCYVHVQRQWNYGKPKPHTEAIVHCDLYGAAPVSCSNHISYAEIQDVTGTTWYTEREATAVYSD